MKGKLSLLSAAVLMALAGSSSADATQKPKEHALRSNLNGHLNQQRHTHAITPRGSTLYDQTSTSDSYGAFATDFSTSSYAAYSAEGADDFVVTDASGWTVTGFVFGAFGSGGGTPPPTIALNVYDDGGSTPGTTAECSYTGLPATYTGSPTFQIAVTLPSNCVLSQGTHWVSWAFESNGGGFGFWQQTLALHGQGGVWRNPLDGFGTGCSDWSPFSSCGLSNVGSQDFSFVILGTVGGGGGGCGAGELCLTSTVGTDLSSGACASTDTIDATVGDQINFCYTITNNTGVELDYHTLADNVNGAYFTLMNQPVPDGGTFQYNRIATVSTTQTYNSTWTGQDVPPGYSAEVTSGGGGGNDRIFCDGFDGSSCAPLGGGFVDITGTGTSLGLGDDQSVPITMPFSFNLYGTTSNQICIDNNGFVLFNTSSCPGSGLYSNVSLPAGSLPAPAIMPLWDDFDSESGDVYYETQGTTPNRQFIVEWYDRVHYSGTSNTDGATFELILNEDGTIQYEYQDVEYTGGFEAADCSGGACATIGLQNDTTLYNQFSAFEVAVTDNSGIKWTATNPQVFVGTDSATVNVGAPIIVVNPTSLSGTAPSDGTTTVPFDISNIGDRDLNWNLDEAGPANAHIPFGPRYVASTLRPGETASSVLRPPMRTDRKPGSISQNVPHPQGATTPSYGCVIVSSSSCTYVSFDADAPATLTNIGTVNELTFAGTFVDNDFTKEYILGYPSGALETVDTGTGAVTTIGGGEGTNGRGITWDSTTNTLFGAVINGSGVSTDLYTIDPGTGAYTLVGPISGSIGASGYAFVMGIAVDPSSGLMYGIEIVSSTLIAIDKTTGAASTIGPLGYTTRYAQGMAFNPANGQLYVQNIDLGTGTSITATVDTGTGTATQIGAVGSNIIQMGAFGVAVPNGPCAQPQDLPWLSFDTSSGTTPPSGSSPVSVMLDGNGFTEGDVVDGTVCVHSNDPTNRLIEVPAEMTVGPAGGGGGIVDSGVINAAVPATTAGLYINWLTGDQCTSSCSGTYNFNPWGSSTLGFFWSSPVTTDSSCVSAGGTSCDVLASGATIGPASNFADANAASFQPGVDGYIGFEFMNTNTSQMNYGYAHVTTTGPNGVPMTIVEYWYDNTGAAITIP